MASLVQRLRTNAGSLLAGGTALVLGTVVITNLLRIVSSVTLTRLLDAKAFAIIGIISSIMFVVGMLSDIGVLPFIVRHKDGNDPRLLDEVWTVRLIRGFVLALCTALISGPLAAYAGKPELQAVVAIWGINFLIDGLASMSFATAVRQQQLKRLSLMDLAAAVLQVVLSIAATAILRSFWGIVVASFLTGGFKVIMSYWLFPGSARRVKFSRARAAEVWRFSRYIVGSSIMTLMVSQSDKLFFARVMSLETFGLYTIATTLALAPMGLVSPFCERILFPTYAKTAREAPEQMRKVYYARKRLVTWLFLFAMGGFIGSAPLVVEILYDPRYRSVAPLLQLLALGPAFALGNWAADRVLIATGHIWSTAAGNVVRVVWLAGGGLLSYQFGHQMMLVAVVGTMEIATAVFHWIVLKYYGLFDIKEELMPLALGGVGFAIGTAASSLILRFALG